MQSDGLQINLFQLTHGEVLPILLCYRNAHFLGVKIGNFVRFRGSKKSCSYFIKSVFLGVQKFYALVFQDVFSLTDVEERKVKLLLSGILSMIPQWVRQEAKNFRNEVEPGSSFVSQSLLGSLQGTSLFMICGEECIICILRI